MIRRRVVITGMGAVTPVGHSVAKLYDAQIHGRSGVDFIRNFDASHFPTQFPAEVKNFDLGQWFSEAEDYAHYGLNTRFAMAAAQQALGDAEAKVGDIGLDRTRFGVYLGNGEGQNEYAHLIGVIALAAQLDRPTVEPARFFEAALKRFDRRREQEIEMHGTAGRVAGRFGLLGANYSCLTACAA